MSPYDPSTWDVYAYAGNNPVNFTDPFGLAISKKALEEDLARNAALREALKSHLNASPLVPAGAPQLVDLWLADWLPANDEEFEQALNMSLLSFGSPLAVAPGPRQAAEKGTSLLGRATRRLRAAAEAGLERTKGLVERVFGTSERRAKQALAETVEGAVPRGTSFLDDASAPIGRRGSSIEIAPGTNSPATIGGRQYTGHALDRMQGRGIMPSAVDDAIRSNPGARGADGSFIHYSPTNNVSVVLNADGSVRTVSYGRFRPR